MKLSLAIPEATIRHHVVTLGKTGSGKSSALRQLAEGTRYRIQGGFKQSLSRLRTAGVIVGKNSEVMRASEELTG